MHTSVSNLLYSHTLVTVSLANKLQDSQICILCNFAQTQVFILYKAKDSSSSSSATCSKVQVFYVPVNYDIYVYLSYFYHFYFAHSSINSEVENIFRRPVNSVSHLQILTTYENKFLWTG